METESGVSSFYRELQGCPVIEVLLVSTDRDSMVWVLCVDPVCFPDRLGDQGELGKPVLRLDDTGVRLSLWFGLGLGLVLILD